jgi:hypothetical protein
MKTENLRLAIIAAALTGAMSASAVTLTFNGVDPGENVTLQVSGGITINPGIFPAGIWNQTIDGVPTPSFCIDVARDISLGQTLTDYNYTDLSLAPLNPAGPMGVQAATDIEKLWFAYYPAATVSDQDAAALQVAIWEDVAAKVGTYTVIVNGNNLSDPIYSEAASMLSNLPNITGEASLVGLISPDGQNYVVPLPTPEPTTLTLAGLGGLTVLLLRRRK